MRKNSRCVGEGHLGKGKAMRVGLFGIGGYSILAAMQLCVGRHLSDCQVIHCLLIIYRSI